MRLAGRRRAGRADAQPECLVDLIAVDAQRQRAAEIGVGEPLRDLGIARVALVDVEHEVGAGKAEIEVDLVVALLLVLQQHRQLAEVDVALLLIVLAGDRAQVDDLEVLGQRELHLVDIGQLVAVGIDRVVVRIALQHPDRRVDRRTLRHGPSTGSSGLSSQSFLKCSICTQFSKPSCFARAFAASTEEYFGRNCFR